MCVCIYIYIYIYTYMYVYNIRLCYITVYRTYRCFAQVCGCSCSGHSLLVVPIFMSGCLAVTDGPQDYYTTTYYTISYYTVIHYTILKYDIM